MTKRQTDPAWEGLPPGARKGRAQAALRELEQERSPEQIRQAKRQALEEEIRLAEQEEADSFVAGQEPLIKQAVARYAAHRMTLGVRCQSALQGMKEAAAQAVVTEQALREAQERLSRAVEGRYRVRIDQSQGTPDQVRQLIMNLTLEADAEFRRRWKGLLEELETGEIWEGLSPGDDPLANVLHQGLMRAIHQEIGGRPLPFKRGR